MMSLLPALAVATVASISNLGRWSQLVGGIAVGLMGMATLQQHLDRSELHIDVSKYVASRMLTTDVVVAPERIRARFVEHGADTATIRTCLSAMPDTGGVWWIQAQPIENPFVWMACGDSTGRADAIRMDGWSVQETWTAGPPEHERNAAGFVRPVAAFYFSREAAKPVGDGWARIRLGRRLWDGLDRVSLETRRLEPDGRWSSLRWFDSVEGEAPVVSLAQPAFSRVSVRARPEHRSWLPEWSLLDPYRRDVQAWELMLVDPQLRAIEWTLPAVSFRDPAWVVLRRCLSLLLIVCFGLGVFRRRVG